MTFLKTSTGESFNKVITDLLLLWLPATNTLSDPSEVSKVAIHVPLFI